MRIMLAVAAGVAGVLLGAPAAAHADDADIPNVSQWVGSDRHPTPGTPGCESIPNFGLSPYIRSICDSPIYPDGGWIRYRILWSPKYVHSTCFGELYQGGCPNWAKDGRDVVPATSNESVYVVKPDAIPEGEPGHLG